MNPHLIQPFIESLARGVSSATATNPYRNPVARRNLELYLQALCRSKVYSRILLVGEAPGKNGCALTGIPFTSERILNQSTHPFIASTRAWVTKGNTTEATSTIVWEYFQSKRNLPALWNIFPFHPHDRSGNNRTPRKSEIVANAHLFSQLLQIICPEKIIAVGQTASDHIPLVLPTSTFSNVPSVRHPANGWKRDFVTGLNQLGLK